MKKSGKPTASEPNSETQIWSSILDGRYTVAVHRLGRYCGELTIQDSTRLIHREEVALMYGALFGPDVADVSTWQHIATTVVDSLKQPLEIPGKGRPNGGPIA